MLKGQGPTATVSLWNIAANTWQAIYKGILTPTTILTTCNATCDTTYLLLSRLSGLRSGLWSSAWTDLAGTASVWGMRTASAATRAATVSASSILLISFWTEFWHRIALPFGELVDIITVEMDHIHNTLAGMFGAIEAYA